MIFSICVAREGGVFSIGDVNKDKHLKFDEDATFVAIAGSINGNNQNVNVSRYSVNVHRVEIGGIDAEINLSDSKKSDVDVIGGVPPFIDSGTSEVYLPSKAY